jgi:hypothetical protein
MVGIDEYVEDDITAYGSVTIRGWVKGSIQSYSGRILVTETGQVDGDIEGPRIVIRPGAVIIGEVREVDIPIPGQEVFSAGGIWIVFGFSMLLFFIGFIGFTLLTKPLERLASCTTTYRARTFTMGILMTMGLLPLVALISVTVVGLLVVWLVPIAYAVAMLLGIVILSRDLGRSILGKVRRGGESGLLNFVAGLACFISLWYTVALLLGSSSSVAHGFGIFFLVTSILVTTYPIFSGVGAAFLTRFGYRDYSGPEAKNKIRGDRAPAPAPPPIPDKPPPVTPNKTGLEEGSNDGESDPGPSDEEV